MVRSTGKLSSICKSVSEMHAYAGLCAWMKIDTQQETVMVCL